MKKIILNILLCCFVLDLTAQTTCLPPDNYLSTNEISSLVNPLYLWWDKSESQFIYPAGSQSSPVFAGGIWVTAMDTFGRELTSISTYGASQNQFDFQPGPVGTGGNFTSSEYFCRSFKVTKTQISNHLADLADGNLDDPIAEIMEWPGKGNSLLPISAINRNLAPFVDLNSDGNYQPELGEYPDFKADEAIWWVTNDFTVHGASNSDPVGVEVQVLAQAYQANNHPASKAQLYTVKVINEGSQQLDSLGLTLWIDPDLGCPSDDAIGSIPSLNALYAYNLDSIDGQVGSLCPDIEFTYGDDPPIVFFQSLSATLNGFTPSLRFSGILQGSAPLVPNPNFPAGFFDYSHGRWNDGTPLTFGGDGYSGTIPTNWIYSGNPADNSSWSQCNSSQADRRIFLNVNLLEKFNPDDEFTSDFLVSIVSGVALPCPNINAALPTLDSIVNYIENTVVSSVASPRITFKELSLKPNPARDAFSISIGNNPAALQSGTLFDGLGRVVEQYSAESLTGQLEVAHLPRGVYSLIARDVTGGHYRSRLVLQ